MLDSAQPEETEQPDENSPLGKRSAAVDTARAPKTVWERVESTFRLLSLIAIAASAAVSALNFYQGYLDTKKERSVALMSEWQSTGTRDTYKKLGNLLIPVITAVGPIPANLPPKARQLARRQIGAKLFEGLKSGEPETLAVVSAQVDEVVMFFSEVEFCVRADLCDTALLKDYFGTEVTLFWDYFETYALEQRDGHYPTYGDAVEALALNFSDL